MNRKKSRKIKKQKRGVLVPYQNQKKSIVFNKNGKKRSETQEYTEYLIFAEISVRASRSKQGAGGRQPPSQSGESGGWPKR